MHQQPHAILHARARSEGGAVLIFVAVIVLLLAAFGALAVDGSHIYAMRTRCQTTADSAALAAGTQLPNLVAAQLAAIEYGTKNMDPSVHGVVIDANDVEFGKWDFDTRTFTVTSVVTDLNAVRVTARRSQDNANPTQHTLATMLGSQSTDVARSAVAAFSPQKPWDLGLLQDVSGSFAAELNQAKLADHNLLDCFESAAPPTSLFGVVTFAGWSKVLAPMTAVGPGYATLNTAINNIKICGSAGAPQCNGTDIATGLQTLVNMMIPASSGSNVPKAIVLVSDGQPVADSGGSHPTMNATQLKALATQWANSADAANISIFVVYYDGDNNAVAKAYMQTLVRGEGVFLSTPDPTKIPDLLAGICGKLINLHLVD